jgi:prevent-host-death family protein
MNSSKDFVMRVSVTDAKAQLTYLVRRAEEGDEIILTRHGHAAVRLVPVQPRPSAQEKRALLESVRASGARKAKGGPMPLAAKTFYMTNTAFPSDRLLA